MVNINEMTGWMLFLDDERMPASLDDMLFIARDVQGAIDLVTAHKEGPIFISFDHDLGAGGEAIDFVKWLIEQDMDHNGMIPKEFRYIVHSQNPVGKANIEGLLNSYLSFRKTIS